MKNKFILYPLFFIFCAVGVAQGAADVNRRGMTSQYSSGRAVAVASKNQITAGSALTANKSSIKAETPSAAVPADKRDKEKQACMGNNIGIGNTFVWASRYSNTNNYASMVEDVEMPENNTCFVRIELKSDDSRINISDVAPVYYEMGRNITCGAWADSKKLESRILDAKKSARTWGTVAGVVGGAGLGVGAMELFGNKLIGGAVQGQKALSDSELMRSQMIVLKNNKDARYDELKRHLNNMDQECKKFDAGGEFEGQTKPEECDRIDYKALLSI